MKKVILILSALFVYCLYGCGNSQSRSDNDSQLDVDEVVDYTNLIEIVDMKSGYEYVSSNNTAYPKVILTVKNISGEKIKRDIDVKYRFIDNKSVLDESIKHFHSELIDTPWEADYSKLIQIDGIGLSNGNNRDISIQIYDMNNNLILDKQINKGFIQE